MRAIRDANVPKFLMEDLKLFTGIVSDLFPKIQDVPVDYGEMELSIREKSIEHGLEDVEGTNEHLLLKRLLSLGTSCTMHVSSPISPFQLTYLPTPQTLLLFPIAANILCPLGFVNKCIQLYETTVVRHGLMLVGPSLSGKTKCYHVLRDALSSLKGKSTPGGVPFEQVYSFVLNPKSITMGQLYGEFDAMTHEW